MVKTINLVVTAALCVLLTACDEEWQADNTIIARDDFAMIQLEADICRNALNEGYCLRHLKARIR